MNQALKITLTVIITAVITGSGVYYWQNSKTSLQPLIIEDVNNKQSNPYQAEQEQTQISDNVTKPLQQPTEIEKITQKISAYCEKYNIPKCLPITSYLVVDLDDKYSVVKIGDSNYLLTKKSNEWNVSIASQENNICATGSDNSDLIEYCRHSHVTKGTNK